MNKIIQFKQRNFNRTCRYDDKHRCANHYDCKQCIVQKYYDATIAIVYDIQQFRDDAISDSQGVCTQCIESQFSTIFNILYHNLKGVYDG